MIVSLRVRKASTLACSRWEASVSFSSSACSWACCAQVGLLLLDRGRRVSASRARSSLPCASAWRRLVLELVRLLVQRLDLQLEPLARGGDVGDAAA